MFSGILGTDPYDTSPDDRGEATSEQAQAAEEV